MKKIVTILGARPQFIKGAVLSRIIQSHKQINEVIIHTGQHFDNNMSTIFFEEMQIPKPKYNLGINNLSHGAMTGQMLEKIEAILLDEKPDLVVVYGDTNSTLAGALAAKKLHIKVAHIEAGLRSYNMEMPEEINRILTDRIADLLSCPTQTAIKNLETEGFNKLSSTIKHHGDIMKDAVNYYSKIATTKSKVLLDLDIHQQNFILATIHRQENTDNKKKLEQIFKALEAIDKNSKIILPLHPRTKKMLSVYNISTTIKTISPVGYFDMLVLLQNCEMVITDSGGLQKEAFFNKKPCIIAREETEWSELVTHKYAKITSSCYDQILKAYQHFSSHKLTFDKELYGSNVGEKIYQSILEIINYGDRS